MRPALIIIAALAGAVALSLLLFWPSVDEAAEEESALPLYVAARRESTTLRPMPLAPVPRCAAWTRATAPGPVPNRLARSSPKPLKTHVFQNNTPMPHNVTLTSLSGAIM